MRTIVNKFESLSALSSFIANNEVNGWFKKNNKKESETGSKYFTGTESFEAANDLMLQGWSEGAARVQKYMNAGATATAPKRQLYNSVVGFAPNVPNYLSGNPLNMINQKRVKTPKKVVTIVYACCVPWNVDSSDLEHSAAKLFNVISGLEASGVRVGLWVIDAAITSTEKETIYTAVKIKTAGQPFNLLKMVYPAVNTSFFRRHCFAVRERSNTKYGWGSYGCSLTETTQLKAACDALRIPSDNVFNHYILKDKTEAEIAKMIK